MRVRIPPAPLIVEVGLPRYQTPYRHKRPSRGGRAFFFLAQEVLPTHLTLTSQEVLPILQKPAADFRKSDFINEDVLGCLPAASGAELAPSQDDGVHDGPKQDDDIEL